MTDRSRMSKCTLREADRFEALREPAVAPEAQAMLLRFDTEVRHHEVLADPRSRRWGSGPPAQ